MITTVRCSLFVSPPLSRPTNPPGIPNTQTTEHEPEYFAAVSHLSNAELAAFTEADLTEVRVGTTAYGIHIFGKVRIPAMPDSGPAYIHFRMFSPGSGEEAKLHCIQTEEKDEEGGGKTFRAIFTKDDPLEWFDN